MPVHRTTVTHQRFHTESLHYARPLEAQSETVDRCLDGLTNSQRHSIAVVLLLITGGFITLVIGVYRCGCPYDHGAVATILQGLRAGCRGSVGYVFMLAPTVSSRASASINSRMGDRTMSNFLLQ